MITKSTCPICKLIKQMVPYARLTWVAPILTIIFIICEFAFGFIPFTALSVFFFHRTFISNYAFFDLAIFFSIGIGTFKFAHWKLAHLDAKRNQLLTNLKENIFVDKGHIVTFKFIRDEHHLAEVQAKISAIFAANPAANLHEYEQSLSIKILNIEKASLPPPPPKEVDDTNVYI